MKIGHIELNNPVVLAPMAGVTDIAFRLLVKEMGCALLYSEMISDKGLLYHNRKTLSMLTTLPEERPIAIQIFGSDPDSMARAAQLVEEHAADIIDINMGCPMKKVVCNQEGAALLRQPQLAYAIMKAVVQAVKVPVTVKIRIGWDDQTINAVDMARLAEKAGIAAVAVHGRTREQFYTGRANWNVIAAVKQAVSIPVIGNGDVQSPQDAWNLLQSTGCDAVMIGRAAQGNPWIFRRIIQYLQTGELLPEPTLPEKVQVMVRQLNRLIDVKGEYIAVREMRKHASWYVKGCYQSARYRELLNRATTRNEMVDLFDQIAQQSGKDEQS